MWVSCVCVGTLCVSKLCVGKLCVSKLCVSKLCVSCVVPNQKQEPHTMMWGKKQHEHTPIHQSFAKVNIRHVDAARKNARKWLRCTDVSQTSSHRGHWPVMAIWATMVRRHNAEIPSLKREFTGNKSRTCKKGFLQHFRKNREKRSIHLPCSFRCTFL